MDNQFKHGITHKVCFLQWVSTSLSNDLYGAAGGMSLGSLGAGENV